MGGATGERLPRRSQRSRSSKVRPKSLKILGDNHRVVYTDKLRVSCGEYRYGSIKVSSDGAARWIARALLHEFAHGVFRCAKDPDNTQFPDDEDFARLFETGVTNLIRDNWEAVKWAREALRPRG